MVCHEFKGGIGTASRVVPEASGGFTVGVLVQANYGARERLEVNGVPVGEAIPTTDVPSPYHEARASDAGSIIVIVGTDAPLLPGQCSRLAQRVGLGIARVGGCGANSSGDLFLTFSTANRGRLIQPEMEGGPLTMTVDVLSNEHITELFYAVVEATEEAIVNALLAAETMTGRDGVTAHALPVDRLLEVMKRYGRGPSEAQ